MTSAGISVIIPHLNQPDYLRRCLQSLEAQNFELSNVEIIVVDNGSHELPTEICASYKNVKLMSEAKPGPGPARNTGVDAAQNEQLAFIDADCIADPNWLEATTQALKIVSRPIIGGDVRIAYGTPHNMTALEAYESVFAYRQKEYIETMGFSGTGNLATTKAVIAVVGPFRGIEVAEDRDWGNRATAMNYKIAYIPEMIVRHPARKTFAELQAKWDRHISHDFENYSGSAIRRLKWLARSFIIFASGMFDGIKAFRSDRLETAKQRLQACGVLMTIRAYRAYQMLGLLLRRHSISLAQSWNRNIK